MVHFPVELRISRTCHRTDGSEGTWMNRSQWMAAFPYGFEPLEMVLGKSPFTKEFDFGIQRLDLQSQNLVFLQK